MKKLLLALLLFASPVFGAATYEYGDGWVGVTLSQISTASNNATTAFSLGPYESAGIQCVWGALAGPNPTFVLQTSNDNSNWNNVTGASTATTGASGSSTWLVSPLVSKYARIYIPTSSTAGTLDCIGVLNK